MVKCRLAHKSAEKGGYASILPKSGRFQADLDASPRKICGLVAAFPRPTSYNLVD